MVDAADVVVVMVVVVVIVVVQYGKLLVAINMAMHVGLGLGFRV